MTKANECTCPSGDGSLRHPCPAHPASVELAGVAANLTFINGRPAMCGCQVEYSSGGGEYSDVIYVTLCAKHSGSAILDLVATNRIALTPEYEGQWHADLYLDREIPLAKAEGATPAEAVLALMSAERIEPEQGWAGWQARAALAQPSSANCETEWSRFDPFFVVDHIRRNTIFDADLVGRMLDFAIKNGPSAQPSPAQAEQAEVERPEIVATLFTPNEKVHDDIGFKAFAVAGDCDKDGGEFYDPEKLMTVAQHERIAGALRFERQQMDRAFTACINERDAALANVDALAVQVLKLGGTISFDYHPVAQAGQVPQAWLDVQAERRRQVEAEGWTPEHDDEHACDEIAAFACFYAMPPAARDWDASSTGYGDTLGEAIVPEGWEPKTGDRRRELVKAGGLILAEIERLDRAAAPGKEGV
ncbi:TPA: hypothetical protein L4R57_001791 [Pseudomonas aeruginosa]|nr:hypothetical protein [Pseudomonas aeruginosa]